MSGPEIGFQLSSIAPYLDTVESLEKALYMIAKIGYRYVELQSVSPQIPDKRIADALKRNGLTCVSTQEEYAFGFGSYPLLAIERAAECGAKYISFSMIPPQINTYDQLKRLATTLERIHEKVNQAGMLFAYHPTDMDYRLIGRSPLYERLMGLLPEDIRFSFCVHSSFGRVPYAQILEKYKGRCDIVHFMDSIVRADGALQLMPLGEGERNWRPIYDACVRVGVEYIFAEQSNWDRDAFECAAVSHAYLHGLHTETR